MIQATIRDFLKLESSGGILLMAAAALALIAANTGAADLYARFIDTLSKCVLAGWKSPSRCSCG